MSDGLRPCTPAALTHAGGGTDASSASAQREPTARDEELVRWLRKRVQGTIIPVANKAERRPNDGELRRRHSRAARRRLLQSGTSCAVHSQTDCAGVPGENAAGLALGEPIAISAETGVGSCPVRSRPHAQRKLQTWVLLQGRVCQTCMRVCSRCWMSCLTSLPLTSGGIP